MKWRVWARKPIEIEGKKYVTGARILTAKNRPKFFKSREAAVRWSHNLFGSQWPELIEIALA